MAAAGGAETFGQLLPPLGEMVRGWLAEDVPSFDYGGAVVGDKPESMSLFCKSPVGFCRWCRGALARRLILVARVDREQGVLAGCPFFDAVMDELGCT